MSSDVKTRQRLDQALVARGLVSTRSRARDLVRRGAVRVNGTIATRPAATVEERTNLAIDAEADRYVSRGGLKLAAALAHFEFQAQGRVALDIGASTGGFTDVLLQAGATRVHAIDVGHDQLHPRIAADPRVVRRDGTDARALTRGDIADVIEAIVADVSFVSLTKVLSAPLDLAAPGCWLVVLVKPQFEAGRAAVGKGGIVVDPADRERAVTEVSAWIEQQSQWRAIGRLESPIAGGSGNIETLLGAIKDG